MTNDVAPAECPLEVADSDIPISHRQLNVLMRQVGRYHLIPMKQGISRANEIMDAHLLECNLRQAKIMGGLRVIQWLIGSGLALYVGTTWAKYVGIL